MSNKPPLTVPRIIWILWFQGQDDVPYVVKKCLASWKKYNPGWKINFLNETNIKEYVDTENIIGRNFQVISKQALTDVVRINLLAKYGGVWTDATCFCCKPLDEWLGSYTASGFFAFRNPGNDRPISSWFLASPKECQLTSKYCEEVNLFWSKVRFTNENNRISNYITQYLEKRIERLSYKSVRFRMLFFAIRSLNGYPYYWFHYVFALIIKNKYYRDVWESSKKYHADIPHKLQLAGLFKPLSDELKLDIDAGNDPLYKLTWKFAEKEFVSGCTLDYLLHKV